MEPIFVASQSVAPGYDEWPPDPQQKLVSGVCLHEPKVSMHIGLNSVAKVCSIQGDSLCLYLVVSWVIWDIIRIINTCFCWEFAWSIAQIGYFIHVQPHP